MSTTQHELNRALAQLERNRSLILIIAGESDSDHRSVMAELRALRGEGRGVRGRAGERIRRVLVARGVVPDELLTSR